MINSMKEKEKKKYKGGLKHNPYLKSMFFEPPTQFFYGTTPIKDKPVSFNIDSTIRGDILTTLLKI
jgi:hypothetical protein